MKVLLVRPQFGMPELKRYPPMGLVTIVPYFDAEVRICDLQSGDSLADSMRSLKPDIVGISGFATQMFQIKEVAREVKLLDDKVKVVLGGAATAILDKTTKLDNVDVIVKGDGETYATSPRTDVGFIDAGFHDFKDHLVPCWSLIDYRQYLKTSGLAVETSRGCPMNCVFCTAHLVNGKKWRPRLPDDIVNELRYLHTVLKARLFYFTDDNATVSPKRWLELMQKIADAHLGIQLAVEEGIQAHHLDYDTLLLMKKAGFRHITIGAESGVQRVLDWVIDKGGLKVERVEQVVRDCHKIGLAVSCFFVIGIVGETLKEAETTVEFAEHLRKLGAYSCMVRNCLPIPRTRVFNIAKEKGYLTVKPEELNDLKTAHSGRHFLSTPEWTPKQVEDLMRQAQKQDAAHILKHQKLYIAKKGIPRLFSHPKSAVKRLWQLVKAS